MLAFTFNLEHVYKKTWKKSSLQGPALVNNMSDINTTCWYNIFFYSSNFKNGYLVTSGSSQSARQQGVRSIPISLNSTSVSLNGTMFSLQLVFLHGVGFSALHTSLPCLAHL